MDKEHTAVPEEATYIRLSDWTALPSQPPLRRWSKQLTPRAYERFVRKQDLGGEWHRLPEAEAEPAQDVLL
jgi:hypothetical protein